jgi:hypothetical protein
VSAPLGDIKPSSPSPSASGEPSPTSVCLTNQLIFRGSLSGRLTSTAEMGSHNGVAPGPHRIRGRIRFRYYSGTLPLSSSRPIFFIISSSSSNSLLLPAVNYSRSSLPSASTLDSALDYLLLSLRTYKYMTIVVEPYGNYPLGKRIVSGYY